MNPLRQAVEYLLGGPKVGGAREARLAVWRSLPEPDLRRPRARIRYVVVDTETTGLDVRRDRVIAIGAATVDHGRLHLSGWFETVPRQDRASADANILLHGIGGQSRLQGAETRAGVLDFLEFIGRMPLVASRAEFDATMLERTLKAIVGFPLRRTWIDPAFLLPALVPGTQCRTLDDWLDHFGRAGAERHHAFADAFASAQLLRIALAAADRHDMGTAATLVAMQKARRWLGKRQRHRFRLRRTRKQTHNPRLRGKAAAPSCSPGCQWRMADDTILETRGLTKEFKGFVAVRNVSLAVRRGTIHALIGPNGAGKTTCFNLLTHFLTPTSGQIFFNGRDITGSRPAKIARMGLVRSFQISAVFPHLTVLENVRIALQRKRGQSFDFWRAQDLLTELDPRARALIDAVGLAEFTDTEAVLLSYGRKRALEIATTLALDPEMMLLDEPTAGMAHEDVERISTLIKTVAKDRTVLMVEHNLSVVSKLSDHITVLARGEILAQGNYATVSTNPDVVQAYMGAGNA